MRNLKKILALVLSLMMVLSVMVTASAADYSDADEIQYTEAVDLMSALGILKGADGKFDPNGTLTREQAAKIIAYIKLGVDTDAYLATLTTDKFADVTNNWAMKYIAYCSNEGIIDGGKDADGVLKFDPKGTLTGYQFGKMVLNALGIDGEYTNNPNWTLEVAKNLNLYGLKEGMETIVLSANITREQASQLAFNAMKKDFTGTTTGKWLVSKKGADHAKYDGALDGEKFASRLEAITTVKAMYPNAVLGTNFEVNAETSSENSILATTWKTTEGETTDEFGRDSRTWVIDKDIAGTDDDVTVIAATEAPKYTFTATAAISVSGASTLNEGLNTALGLTKATEKVVYSSGDVTYLNGEKTGSWIANSIKIGDEVEIYMAAGSKTDIEKIIITRYDLYTVGATNALNPKNATDATAIKAGYSTKTEYTAVTETGTVKTVYDNTYAKGSYVLAVVIGKEAVLSKEAETVTGKIDATKGSTNVRLDGVWYKVAGSVTANITTKDAVYVINEQGALETVVTEETPAVPNIYYLVSTYTIETAASNDGYGTVIPATTSYYAQIIDMNGVESKILIGWQKTDDGDSLVGVNTLDANKFVTYAAAQSANEEATDKAAEQAVMDSLGIKTVSDAPAAYNSDTAPVFAAAFSADLAAGKTTVTTSAGKVYVNDATKYVFVQGTKATLKTTVLTGGINAKVDSGAKALVTKDADGNYIVVAVIAGTSYVDAGVAADEILYVYKAQSDTVKTVLDAAAGTYKYEYEVYSAATGEKLTIEATNASLAAGFYSYKITDGVYTLTSKEDAALKTGETYTGKFGTKITTTSFSDYEAVDAAIVDLRTAAEIAEDEVDTLTTVNEIHTASADNTITVTIVVDTAAEEVVVIFITGVTAKG